MQDLGTGLAIALYLIGFFNAAAMYKTGCDADRTEVDWEGLLITGLVWPIFYVVEAFEIFTE